MKDGMRVCPSRRVLVAVGAILFACISAACGAGVAEVSPPTPLPTPVAPPWSGSVAEGEYIAHMPSATITFIVSADGESIQPDWAFDVTSEMRCGDEMVVLMHESFPYAIPIQDDHTFQFRAEDGEEWVEFLGAFDTLRSANGTFVLGTTSRGRTPCTLGPLYWSTTAP